MRSVSRGIEDDVEGPARGGERGATQAAALDTQAAALDRQLAALARREAGLRLRIGELLDVLGGRYSELGFPSLVAYSRERLSRMGESGDGSGADAELLDAIEGLTVRELREVLRTRADGTMSAASEAHDGESSDVHVLQLTLPREDALALAEAEVLIRHVEGLGPRGTGLDDSWVEPLLAEGITSLLDFSPATDGSLWEPIAERFANRRRLREEAEARREREEERTEPGLGLGVQSACEADESAEMFGCELPWDARAIDSELRALCRELHLLDGAFAELADRFWRMKHWRTLGFANETQYARERLGMSRSSVRQRIGLVRRVGARSLLARALASGRVGFEAACLVSRVTPAPWGRDAHEAAPWEEVEVAWVERAEVRTYKHLREEVSAVQLLARLEGRSFSAGPPTEQELERVRSMERDARSGDAAREAAMDVEADIPPVAAVVQMSVTLPLELARRLELGVATEAAARGPSVAHGQSARYLGCTTARLRVSEEVALFFRQLEAAYACCGLPGRFVPFLVSALFQSFGELLGDRSRWDAIHRRDRYECSSPVCERQDVTLHHLTYRSHGGGDEAANLLSLCSFCHLDGEHGGRLRVRGSASEPTWRLGPPSAPLLVVHGRDLAAPDTLRV